MTTTTMGLYHTAMDRNMNNTQQLTNHWVTPASSVTTGDSGFTPGVVTGRFVTRPQKIHAVRTLLAADARGLAKVARFVAAGDCDGFFARSHVRTYNVC